MAGGLGVKENVHVEKWAHMREHLELGFKFSKNAGKLAVFGVAVPVLVYAACVGEFVRAHTQATFEFADFDQMFSSFSLLALVLCKVERR